MPDASARLPEIRAEAEAAIAAAATAAELEELRVRYLGRKAELTTMLRSIGDLPPEQRGAVGQGRQRGEAGARGAARRAHRRARAGASSTSGCAPTRST